MTQNPRALVPEFLRLKKKIADLIDLTHHRGLEIGPFDRPFFERGETNVAYLDYQSTDDARVRAAGAIGHFPEFVVEIDYVVPGSGDWSVVPDASFDWILSSHALEHSPNLIGFLKTISSKLTPGGLIITMLPDKRRTFDAYRPLTTIGRIVEDYLTDAKVASLQSVFDYMFYTRSLDSDEAEKLYSFSERDIIEGMDFSACLAAAERGRLEYIDTHNYIFTDDSFATVMRQVCGGGLLDFSPVLQDPTPDGEMTFLNVMRKLAD